MALGEAALYASYRRLERPLFNVLYRLLWQRDDCQDVIHDAYLRIWERRRKVDPAIVDALAWTTALNLARNRLRWRLRWRSVDLDEETLQGDADEQGDFLAARQVRDALRRLPAVSREVLLLAQFGGLRDREIAAVLGIPAGTVASRKHHAMAKLRALLGGMDDA